MDAALTARIGAIHERSRSTYGDPRFQSLYELVFDSYSFDALAEIQPPRDANTIANRALAWLDQRGFHGLRYDAERLLQRILESGGRVTEVGGYAVRGARKFLRTADGYSARPIVRLLQNSEQVDRRVFLQILHSPTVVDRTREIGIRKADLEDLPAADGTSKGVAAAARRQLRTAWRRR